MTVPPPVVQLLMERANLTLEEAWRVFLVEVAAWNYRIHTITHWDHLPPSEQTIFDEAIRVRMTSELAQLMYNEHFKPGLHPKVARYLERTLG